MKFRAIKVPFQQQPIVEMELLIVINTIEAAPFFIAYRHESLMHCISVPFFGSLLR